MPPDLHLGSGNNVLCDMCLVPGTSNFSVVSCLKHYPVVAYKLVQLSCREKLILIKSEIQHAYAMFVQKQLLHMTALPHSSQRCPSLFCSSG